MIRLIGFSFLFCCLAIPLKGQINYDVCAGDTLELSVTVAMNHTVQWKQSLDGIAFYDIPGATFNSYTVAGVMTTRYYRCEITGPECNPWFSEIKKVNVHQLPVLIISGLNPVYCISANPVNLSGNPSGGIFAGNGISGNIFSPSAAGTGTHSITYSYTDGAGCKNTTSVTTDVVSPPTTANAGPDITATAVTVPMAANSPLVGTGSWSVLLGSGGSFAAPSSATSNFTGTPNSVYSLLWTISNPPCAASTDTVVVTMPTGPALPSVYCGTSAATLYVHPTDNAGPMLWGCVGITTAANDLNNGAANTALIVQLCGPGTAAGICDALVAYGYSDWYLPSYNELDCVRANSVAIGGFAADKYWSSNEGAGILYLNAYYRTFPSGVSAAASKSSTMARVRCIRKD
jgi:hypothetical protein